MLTRRGLLQAGAALGAMALLPVRPSLAATDQLRVALLEEPPHLDPTAPGADASTMAISYQNLFEGLTLIGEQGQVLPGLAKAWTLSSDALTYSFALQTEARYHDGTGFDADHVVFSLNRLTAPDSQNPKRALYEGIAGVTAPDEATVRIVLKAPDATFLFNLGRPEAVIVAPESADNNRNVPIGTGPFAYLQWDHGRSLALERNEDYWGLHPRINEATFIFIPDPSAAVAALAAGDLDGLPNFPAAALDPLRNNPAVAITTGLGPDKQPRLGAWNSRLGGMWKSAPLESCVLGGIRWSDDNSAPTAGPAPLPDPSTED